MNQTQVILRPANGMKISAPNPMDIYPEWYQYLLGSYPNSQTSTIQTKAMLHQFRNHDLELMFDAAAEFVATDNRRTKDGQRVFSLPIPTELRSVVERIVARREDEVRQAEQEKVLFRAELRRQRDELLSSWYAGDVGDDALLVLAEEMEQAGMEYAAASLRAKTKPAPERPDYAVFVARYGEKLCGAAANNQG